MDFSFETFYLKGGEMFSPVGKSDRYFLFKNLERDLRKKNFAGIILQ